MKESDICKRFFRTVQIMQGYNQFPKDFFIFHVPNETVVPNEYFHRTHKHLQMMGLIGGVADYMILYDKGWAAIEFKRDAKCKLTDKQQEFKLICNLFGAPYLLTHSDEEAINFLKNL